jgi:hypothetical protein
VNNGTPLGEQGLGTVVIGNVSVEIESTARIGQGGLECCVPQPLGFGDVVNDLSDAPFSSFPSSAQIGAF